jgi:hypothetical protein
LARCAHAARSTGKGAKPRMPEFGTIQLNHEWTRMHTNENAVVLLTGAESPNDDSGVSHSRIHEARPERALSRRRVNVRYRDNSPQ